MRQRAIATLHILNKPPGHERFHACLQAAAPGDTLLLVENAVTALADTAMTLPQTTCALAADCRARGLGDSVRVEQVDYVGMVALTDRFGRVISW
ncbi:MAG: sulfurtransferase complex subunit TusB [Marinobacter sp.]